MKKWFRYIVGGLAALLAVVFAIGYFRSPEVRAEAALEFSQPPEVLYNFLLNVENTPKWSPQVGKVEKISDAPLRFRVTSGSDSTIMECFDLDPPRSFKSKMDAPEMGVSGVWHIRFEPKGAGTLVRSGAVLQLDSPLFRSFALFMDANAEEQKTLLQLKEYLDSNPPN
jgi:hypothetical protein